MRDAEKSYQKLNRLINVNFNEKDMYVNISYQGFGNAEPKTETNLLTENK